MPTYMLLELDPATADTIEACYDCRAVLRADTLADVAHQLDMMRAGKPVDEDDELDAVASLLIDRRAVAERTYGTPHLRAYPGLLDNPETRVPNVLRVLSEQRAELHRAAGMPDGPAYHGDPGAADEPHVVPMPSPGPLPSVPATDSDGDDTDTFTDGDDAA